MKRILITGIVVFLWISWTAADTIVLKNGDRIETQGVWEENGTVKYFKDGTIAGGIPRKEVLRIESAGEEKPAVTAPEAETGPSVVDLDERLHHRHPPKNPIENAGNATVSIQTAVGSGAGFFVTDKGHILTNRHVLEGDPKKFNSMERKITKAEQWLKRTDRQLKSEQQRITAMEHQIKSDPSYDTPYNASVVKDAKAKYRSNLGMYKRQKSLLDQKKSTYRRLKTRLMLQKTITVTLIDKTELTARIERISPKRDLALLKLEGYRTPYIRGGRVPEIAQGQPLYAIGNPFNFSHSVSAGVFSGHQRGMLMTSAPINSGNSGGPLITEEGRVVGINTLKMVGANVEGIGFAIPIHTAIHEFRDLLEPHLGK